MRGFRIDESLELEILRPIHAQELYALVDANRLHLGPWLPWVERTLGEADTLNYIRVGLRTFAESQGVELGILQSGRLAGVIGLSGAGNPNGSCEIGYWLARSAEGKGIMTRACATVIGHAFGELHRHRIQIRCATENFRSQAIPERLGFVREGVQREAERHGESYCDLIVYSMLAREWNPQPPHQAAGS
jgi:ribosomal-protein-serine acetyltransferase